HPRGGDGERDLLGLADAPPLVSALLAFGRPGEIAAPVIETVGVAVLARVLRRPRQAHAVDQDLGVHVEGDVGTAAPHAAPRIDVGVIPPRRPNEAPRPLRHPGVVAGVDLHLVLAARADRNGADRHARTPPGAAGRWRASGASAAPVSAANPASRAP